MNNLTLKDPRIETKRDLEDIKIRKTRLSDEEEMIFANRLAVENHFEFLSEDIVDRYKPEGNKR